MNENNGTSAEALAENLDRPKKRRRRLSRKGREGVRRRVENHRKRQKFKTDFARYAALEQVVRFEQQLPNCPASGGKDEDCPVRTCPHMVIEYQETLTLVRRFAKAARLARRPGDFAEPREGETVLSYSNRIYGQLSKPEGDEFVMPLLSLKSGRFDDRFETVGPYFVSCWLPMDDVAIDVNNLKPLPGDRQPVAVAGIKVGERFLVQGSLEYDRYLREQALLLEGVRKESTAQAIQEIRGVE